MFHTGLSRWYSKQIQFRFRTFAEVLMSFDVFRSFVWRRLVFFRFAARVIDRSAGGPTPIIVFWSELCPVDFNLDLRVCATFCPSMTSDARIRPVFKASDAKVWFLSLIKERPIWTDFRKYFLVHVLSDNVFQRIRDIPFLPDSSSTRDTL